MGRGAGSGSLCRSRRTSRLLSMASTATVMSAAAPTRVAATPAAWAIGPIAQAAGREVTLIGAAALMVVSFLAMLSSRDVRTLRHRLPERAVEESFA